MAAEPLTNLSLFVSRLQPQVSSEELRIHVINISGKESVNCEKLLTKHQNYVSFKITIKDLERSKISNLFQSANWPKGILVKKWYEKKIINSV